MNKRLLVLPLALTVLLGVVAFMPAGLVWSWMREGLGTHLPELAVPRVAGSVWQGRASVRINPYPPISLDWQLSPWQLLAGRLAAQLAGAGKGIAFKGSAWASLGSQAGFSLPAARIDASFVNAYTRRYGLRLVESFDITGLEALAEPTAAGGYWPTAVAGRVVWQGGRIELLTALGPLSHTLPPLEGQASMQNDAIRLRMTRQGQRAALLDIVIKPDGWVALKATRQLMQLLALPLGAPSNEEEEFVYIYEERVF